MKFIKAFLFYFVQFTWGLPQNIVGAIAYLAMKRKCRIERFHYSFITYKAADNFGGVSLGIFIFMNPERDEENVHDTRIHEYGHTIQSLLLGPLYFLVVGIPSAIWCNFPPCVKHRKKNNISYYNLYCEGWANLWGLKWSGENFLTAEMLKRGRYGKPL